jgi:hypothetical protein
MAQKVFEVVECRNDSNVQKGYYFGLFNSLKTTKAAALIPIVNLISAAVYFIDFFNTLIILLAIYVLLRYFRKNFWSPEHIIYSF